MDRVEVDCSNIFKAEQLGVAIGRARKKKGLRLIDFQPRNVTKPDKSLFKFNEQSSVDFLYDLECCEEEQHYAPNFNALHYKFHWDFRGCGVSKKGHYFYSNLHIWDTIPVCHCTRLAL